MDVALAVVCFFSFVIPRYHLPHAERHGDDETEHSCKHVISFLCTITPLFQEMQVTVKRRVTANFRLS
jgi:hypothetical protein